MSMVTSCAAALTMQPMAVIRSMPLSTFLRPTMSARRGRTAKQRGGREEHRLRVADFGGGGVQLVLHRHKRGREHRSVELEGENCHEQCGHEGNDVLAALVESFGFGRFSGHANLADPFNSVSHEVPEFVEVELRCHSGVAFLGRRLRPAQVGDRHAQSELAVDFHVERAAARFHARGSMR